MPLLHTTLKSTSGNLILVISKVFIVIRRFLISTSFPSRANSDSRFPYSVEKYNVKGLSGQFSEVAQALGAFAEKVSDPNDITPAIRRGLEVTQNGRPAVLEFITREEGAYSKF